MSLIDQLKQKFRDLTNDVDVRRSGRTHEMLVVAFNKLTEGCGACFIYGHSFKQLEELSGRLISLLEDADLDFKWNKNARWLSRQSSQGYFVNVWFLTYDQSRQGNLGPHDISLLDHFAEEVIIERELNAIKATLDKMKVGGAKVTGVIIPDNQVERIPQ